MPGGGDVDTAIELSKEGGQLNEKEKGKEGKRKKKGKKDKR